MSIIRRRKLKKYLLNPKFLIFLLVLILSLVIGYFGNTLVRPTISSQENFSEPFISNGDKSLASFPDQVNTKDQAANEFINQNYEEVIKLLELARNSNDPEALIYLNNAEVLNSNKSYHTISVVVPLNDSQQETEKNSGLEILRGVAAVQELVNHPQVYNDYEINQNLSPSNDIRLQVIIADDKNDSKGSRVEDIANSLHEKANLKAVIGHFSSSVTIKAAPFYHANQLILISPTSTANDLFRPRNYILRTVPNNRQIAEKLANYLASLAQSSPQKVLIVYNQQSDYSKDLQEALENRLTSGSIPSTSVDFTNFNFLDLEKDQITAIALLPNGSTRRKAIEIIEQVADLDLVIVGGDSLYNPELTKSSKAQGVIVAAPWFRECSPDDDDLLKISQELYNTKGVSWRTAYAYDAALVLAKALKENPKDRQDLQQILMNPQFEIDKGATGLIRFTDSGDRKQANIQLVTIKGNKFISDCK
ncbi:MAG: ABC transporter substrate-binding protein [Microcystaceae cyanobacterium]